MTKKDWKNAGLTFSLYDAPQTFEELKHILETSEFVDAYLPRREHANMDSLPFRYGIHLRENSYLKITHISDIKPGKREGFVEMNGTFQTEDSWLSAPPQRYDGRIVLLKSSAARDFKVVTIWRNDVDDEYYLSELIKRLRKAGHLTPNDLLEFHPRYESGELVTMEALFLAVVSKGSNPELTDVELDRIRSEIEEDYAAEITHKTDTIASQKKIIGSQRSTIESQKTHIFSQEETIASLQNDMQIRDDEIARLTKDRSEASASGEKVVLSERVVLVAVNRNVKRGRSSCTQLVLSDGQRWYMKTSTFDPNFQITKKAESLIGKPVLISSWDPIGQPGKWSSRGYFRNLYEAE